MNTANPSQCPGNATEWSLCYYKSTTTSAVAYLAVYRPSLNGNQYSLVSGSYSSYSISSNPAFYFYYCSKFLLQQSQQFAVQQGDVIAACVRPSGSGRVGIVARTTGSLKALLYTGNPAITCGTQLPSSILMTRLTSTPITLHVSLGVSSLCALYCSLGRFCFRYQ